MIEQEEKTFSSSQVQSLIAQAKLGDNHAFEQILILYQRQVLGTAIRLLGNVDDGRDAAQEVFLKLHKYLHNFNEEKDFLPWLYQMTVNSCRDIARKRTKHSTLSLDSEKETINNIASSQDIEEEINLVQEKKIINQALETLSEKEKTVLILRDIEGLETKDVARLLGTAEATIRSQISMARVKIKKYRDKFLGKLI
ncbi:MAG: RNA polymerase sigma factor [Blastocatellia bacterium]|nr:RNA polymerase sigma factor [Blastocatellia bacterium]MBN8723770.1 RNA polymerase sigma factor [Acidobacteriota bacterium]